MKVFLAVTSLLPEYGGPAYSVSRLAAALAKEGVEVAVWASDQSAVMTPLLLPRPSIRRLVGTELEAMNRFGTIDLLHDNGVWLPHNHRLAKLAARRGIPRLVSTRGMIEPWALNEKRWKKKAAWWLYQRSDLKYAHRLHATAELEARNVERLGLGVPIVTIPNGVEVPEFDIKRSERRWTEEPKRILYLGRIHPKKGLSMLIRAWAQVQPKGWMLEVVGPDEAGHREQLVREVNAAGLDNLITFLGPLEGSSKSAAFFRADLFVLPTYSENFGIVVAEALAHGVPVLTTKGAPWPTLAERGCGWWVDATVEGLAKGLVQATAKDPQTLSGMGSNGREWVLGEFGWGPIAKKFIATYDQIRSNTVRATDDMSRL